MTRWNAIETDKWYCKEGEKNGLKHKLRYQNIKYVVNFIPN